MPPFDLDPATKKVRAAEEAWNTRDPKFCARGYTEDTRWRNRAEFPVGPEAVVAFLRRKWARELDYRLIKEPGASSATVAKNAAPTVLAGAAPDPESSFWTG